jgi:hypothetical protein
MNVLVIALGLVLMSAPAPDWSICFHFKPDFPEAYERARAVFIGEVVKIDKPLTSEADAPLKDRLHKVTFKVEFSWRGAGFREVGSQNLVVLSDQGQASNCFSWGTFVEGEKYLVYADETPDKDLIVQLGNRTALLSKAAGDLKELRRLDVALLLPPKPRFQSIVVETH